MTQTLESRRAKLRAIVAKAPPKKRRPLVRVERQRTAKALRMIAYDFETTPIDAGTPRPLYLTGYGENPAFALETPIRDMTHLRRVLETQFLIDEYAGAAFVGWNANNFDAYFIAAALLNAREWIMRPYLTRSNSLRGLRITRAADMGKHGAPSWQFLDGLAMLGLVGTPLAKFLDNFAPDHAKLVGVIDFERECFDPDNSRHREYAMRDSVGLWHGMMRAQAILMQRFNEPLRATMGGTCIRILKANMPRTVDVQPLSDEDREIVRGYVMRGGYCFCNRRYVGPVWKYDLNQAYAAAMREATLPAGRAFAVVEPPRGLPYIARLSATNPRNRIPFYYRTEIADRMRSLFGVDSISDTWLTSIEIEQLKREGWRIQYHEFRAWDAGFNLREFVDKLEVMRRTCEGGPSGPVGTMIKAVGNHSYGKTLEELDPVEYILSAECPPGFEPFYNEAEALPVEHLWMRTLYRELPDGTLETEERAHDYHQPQIGAFITAHVRMVVRRAALLAPDAWLYADTDCVIFSRDVTAQLDIDPARYGAWKIEETGTPYRIIAKKVYAEVTPDDAKPKKRSAKGLNVKHLTGADFAAWYEGNAPVQEQTQRNNFIAVMRGAEMYRRQLRRGTAIERAEKRAD